MRRICVPKQRKRQGKAAGHPRPTAFRAERERSYLARHSGVPDDRTALRAGRSPAQTGGASAKPQTSFAFALGLHYLCSKIPSNASQTHHRPLHPRRAARRHRHLPPQRFLRKLRTGTTVALRAVGIGVPHARRFARRRDRTHRLLPVLRPPYRTRPVVQTRALRAGTGNERRTSGTYAQTGIADARAGDDQ